LSGSRSLEVFCPGLGATQSSDFDVYQLADPRAIKEFMHTLRFAGVRWNNFLAVYIKQIKQHELALVPYLTMLDLAEKLQTSPQSLEKYVKSRYDMYSSDFDFFAQFIEAYRECWDKLNGASSDEDSLEEGSWDGDTLIGDGSEDFRTEAVNKMWVYKRSGPTVLNVPESVTCLLQPRSDEQAALDDAKTDWDRAGWPEDLLYGYVKNWVLLAEECHADATFRMNKMFQVEAAEKEGHYSGKIADRQMEEDFQILDGTLPSGTRLQLILVPSRQSSVLHTILGFYATHVISFIGGTLGAHLYYDSAQFAQSYDLDVRDVPWKHRGVIPAKKKYEPRWKFSPLNKGVRKRSAEDKGVLRIDYEHIYQSALRDGQALPVWWDNYFKARETAFTTSSWIENEGRITDTFCGDKFVSSSHSLLDWVQSNLTHSKHVVPAYEWADREDSSWIQLDLWFGGVGTLAHEMGFQESDSSSGSAEGEAWNYHEP
jgi:hypothetical protein